MSALISSSTKVVWMALTLYPVLCPLSQMGTSHSTMMEVELRVVTVTDCGASGTVKSKEERNEY